MLEYFFPANPSSIFPEENIVVKNFNLYQNYPNPFNPSTTISWQLAESHFVSLKIYDVLGNEISTLINEEQQAGFHKIDFNASSLSSGVYFYSLRSNNKTLTNRMILIK